jgi:hypothetical protein
MGKRYTQQELDILLEEVNLGTDISELEKKLERPGMGIAQKMYLLSKEDPDTWDLEKIEPYVAGWSRERWKTTQSDQPKVKRNQQRVLDYLKERPDADFHDLNAAGLKYALWVGYRNRINDARNHLGTMEMAPGGRLQSSIEQRRGKIVDYLREHPNALHMDVRRAGHGYDFNIVGGSIHDLRREAGIVPEGYILGADASRRLGMTKEGASYLFRKGTLEGIKVGANIYVSEASVDEYKQANPVVVQ